MADPHRRSRLLRGPAGRTAGLLLALAPVFAAPTHALARNSDEDVEHYDARVQGFDPDAEAKSSTVALQWGMLFFLGAICIGVMFINAKRSHLD